jgi:hypothetical protein
MLAVLLLSTPALAAVHFQKDGGGGSPSVRSTTVLGSVVAVRVTNPSAQAASVTVEVVAVVDGSPVAGSASVSVPPQSDAVAPVDFGSPVDEVVEVGLIDDGNPM